MNAYEVLGASRADDLETIKEKWKALLKENHPDLHGGSEESVRKTQQINEAWEKIKDSHGRDYSAHERATREWAEAAYQWWKNVNRPTIGVFATLEEIYSGKEIDITFTPKKEMKVRIPPGFPEGGLLDLDDFRLLVQTYPHDRFVRDGSDLHMTATVDLTTAVLGGKVRIVHLDLSQIEVVVPADSIGKTLKVAGRGLVNFPFENRGDLFVSLMVKATDEEKRKLSYAV